MKVRITVPEKTVVLTQDDAFVLIRALEQTTWYNTKAPIQPKGIEVSPDAPF